MSLSFAVRVRRVSRHVIQMLGYVPDTLEGVSFAWVAPVRWWQFWRYHRAWSRDYTLSRAAELLLIERTVKALRKQIDAEG